MRTVWYGNEWGMREILNKAAHEFMKLQAC